MTRYEILKELLDDLFKTANDNQVLLINEPMFKSIQENLNNDYIESDLNFATLCNEIGYLQGKIEYVKG